MKLLTKIILVQWYLFEGQEIPIVGHTAIVGANGAGKSSIIDGVQTVLAGGDKNKISLNRGSNERSSRTIREYCLGIVSDPNSMMRVEPRDSANTYIVLCFHDNDTDEYLSAGISIWASAKDPAETLNGYFITRGGSLSLDDFTEDTKEGVGTLPWNRVRDRLLRRFTLGKDFQNGRASLILPSKGPGDFTRQFYTVMSAEPGMPSNAQTLVKSLLSAIAFKPIADPTRFVQQNMLDPSNINIHELKTSLDFWKDLRDKANQTAQYIDHLDKLERLCETVRQTEIDISLHEHASLAARIEECYEQASPAEAELDDLKDKISDLDGEINIHREETASISKSLWEKTQFFEGQDSVQKVLTLKGEKASYEKEESQIKILLGNRRLECLKLAQLEKSRGMIPEALRSAVDRLLPMVRIDDDLLSADWLKKPESIDAAVAAIKAEYLGRAQGEMSKSIQQLWSQIAPAMEENAKRVRVIAQLANNETPLHSKTLGLIALLKENRIIPIPLCDLIDVKDEAWRNTIEAVLGNIREALIVPTVQAKEAIRLYRYEGKAFRGAHVVNTTKTKAWMDRSQKGSLAELVVTDDPHARAFINLRLGNILCVEKESDLLANDRAATADMMLTSGGVTSMLHEPPLLILGRANRDQQLKRLQRMDEIATQDLGRLQEKQNNLSLSIKVMEGFTESHSDSVFYVEKFGEQQDKETRALKLAEEIALLEGKEDTHLKQVIEGLRKSLETLQGNIKTKEDSLGKKREHRGRLQNVVEDHHTKAKVLTAALQEKKSQNPQMDFAAAADLLGKLRTKHDGSEDSYQAVILSIEKYLNKKRGSFTKTRDEVIEGLQQFLSTYKAKVHLSESEQLKFETFTSRAEFISREKVRLEETTLASYAKQADNALYNVESIFRDKFIGRLGERLKEVKDNIAGLNRILKERPFHGEFYQFRAQPNPELKTVYDLAIDFEADRAAIATVGGLFDPASDPNSRHRAAIEYIKQAFQEEDRGKLIQDYRNYFIFDVEMYNQDGQKVANLKHRIAKGSGGENMAPFYVAIGSSLASAYKIKNRPGRKAYGGMNLAPFDEAFSKLDGANIYNCIEFLKEINLQVLLAAPDDKYTTLASQMNTIIWISRDGGNIEVEMEYLTEKAHNLLLSDNPFIKKNETRANDATPSKAVA